MFLGSTFTAQAAELNCRVYDQNDNASGYLKLENVNQNVRGIYTVIKLSQALGFKDAKVFVLGYATHDNLYVGFPVGNREPYFRELLEMRLNRKRTQGTLRVGHQMMPLASMGKYREYRLSGCSRK